MEAIIAQLQDQLAERTAELEWEKERQAARARALRDPENIFLLFEEANISVGDLNKRRIKCGWCEPMRGPVCGVPATDVLPRPAIFVCQRHKEEWNAKVEEVNAEYTETTHKKRALIQ